jgi:glycyl-tRNA synthetase
MADVDALRAQATTQGGLVRKMKKEGAPQAEITAAVEKLKALKVQLEAATKDDVASTFETNRPHMDDLLKQRMFLVQSFEIYGGVAGFYDFGPPACALKSHFINEWKKHFILHDNMLELECTNLNVEIVLKTSGHVERFTDLMVKDPKTGECHRADHLLEKAIDHLIEKDGSSMTQEEIDGHLLIQRQADAFTPEEIDGYIKKYNILAPSSGAELTKAFPFNLMFKTTIGPEGNLVGYLRPETAQGIFLNFKRLLEYNAGKMPFAGAQVGTGFRNEIAPRAGLLRVREFCMAEIEHFVNPNDKRHHNFHTVADLTLKLFPSKNQLSDGKMVMMKAGDAVKNGVIANETICYFMCRTHLFAKRVGLIEDKIRFRQHLPTEMAHYASDCWDLEIFGSYGWTECAGHADRACYDLEVHAKQSKVDMVASERYPEPRMIEVTVVKPNRCAVTGGKTREGGGGGGGTARMSDRN